MVSDIKIDDSLMRRLLSAAVADLVRSAVADGLPQDQVYWALTAATSAVYFPENPPYPYNPSSNGAADV